MLSRAAPCGPELNIFTNSLYALHNPFTLPCYNVAKLISSPLRSGGSVTRFYLQLVLA